MADGVLTNPLLEEDSVYKKAQDTSKALGVSYEQIAQQQETKPTSTFSAYDSAQVDANIPTTQSATSYIDTAKNTVAGQLTSLLATDSPYIRQQEQKAKEAAASRNMLNSTLAVQAGRTAAIESALPIAQQDAETYTKFGLQQQQADNTIKTSQAEGIISGGLEQQKAGIAERQQAVQNAFNSRLSGANEQSKIAIQAIQQLHDTGMQELEHQQNLILQQVQIDANTAESIRSQASTIMQNYQVSVENLLTDPDFLDLGAEAMNSAINQLQTLARNSIGFVGGSSGVNLDAYLDAYLTDLTINIPNPADKPEQIA